MTARERTDGGGTAGEVPVGCAGRAPRRSFLAALLGGAVATLAAMLAGPWIRTAKGAGRGAGATGAQVPVPPLRPLTRDDLYRDHDLAG